MVPMGCLLSSSAHLPSFDQLAHHTAGGILHGPVVPLDMGSRHGKKLGRGEGFLPFFWPRLYQLASL